MQHNVSEELRPKIDAYINSLPRTTINKAQTTSASSPVVSTPPATPHKVSFKLSK